MGCGLQNNLLITLLTTCVTKSTNKLRKIFRIITLIGHLNKSEYLFTFFLPYSFHLCIISQPINKHPPTLVYFIAREKLKGELSAQHLSDEHWVYLFPTVYLNELLILCIRQEKVCPAFNRTAKLSRVWVFSIRRRQQHWTHCTKKVCQVENIA